jgi:hypothetical protein
MGFAREGNVEGLWSLFDQGLASPFDVDVDGWAVIHVRLIDICTKVLLSNSYNSMLLFIAIHSPVEC